jgi:hypothetical protein
LTPSKTRGELFRQNSITPQGGKILPNGSRIIQQPIYGSRDSYNPNPPSTNAVTYINTSSPTTNSYQNKPAMRVVTPSPQQVTKQTSYNGNLFGTMASPSASNGGYQNRAIHSPGSPTIQRTPSLTSAKKHPYFNTEDPGLKDHYIKKLEEENAYLKAIVDKDKTEIHDLEHKLKILESKLAELRNI